MTCVDFETELADFLDGTLSAARSAALQAHAQSCSGCREFMQDVTAGFQLASRTPDVNPPNDLVTRIAYLAPVGRTHAAHEPPGLLSRLAAKWIQPLLQPRLAMGMAMTILSFSMLDRCTGLKVTTIQSADLNPVRMWADMEDRAVRFKDHAVKYYENLRFVYEIQVQLRDLEQQQAASQDEARRKNRLRQAQMTHSTSGTTNNLPAPEGGHQQ